MSLLHPARKVALVCWSVLSSASALAHAGDESAERRRAAELYDRAVALYESARYAEAARAFYEADEASPSSDALSSAIAAARLAHDDLLIARAARRAVARESSDPKLAGDARAALSEAEAHLARVDLACSPAPCTLSIESNDVAPGRHYLLPGTRVLSARFGAEQVEQRASLAAGSLYTITLTPAPEPEPAPERAPAATHASKPASAATTRRDATRTKPLPAWSFYAGTGVSLTLVGVTIWSGVDALGDVEHYEKTRMAGDRDAAESSVQRTDLLLAGALLMSGLTTYAGIAWVDFGGREQALSVAPRTAGAVVTWSGKL
jgi:hypothetical protein